MSNVYSTAKVAEKQELAQVITDFLAYTQCNPMPILPQEKATGAWHYEPQISGVRNEAVRQAAERLAVQISLNVVNLSKQELEAIIRDLRQAYKVGVQLVHLGVVEAGHA